jgi:hypothetical protein
MALGQASGGWTESSSALRILHVCFRNSVGVLTPDAFTQTNPPIVTAPASTISSKVDTTVLGVLSGSVAFTRPDVGSNRIGGNIETPTVPDHDYVIKPLGVFINNANGNAFENLPGQASGRGPYVSGLGTFGNFLYETALLAGAGGQAQGAAITYVTGARLVASRNAYLMPRDGFFAGAWADIDDTGTVAESEHVAAAGSGTVIGILKMPADSTQNEIVYDQRI